MTNKSFFGKCSRVILPLIFLVSCQNNDVPSEKIQVKLDSLSSALEVQRQITDSLKTALNEQKEDFQIFFGRNYKGISNPEEFIEDELRKHPEMIPLKPVLGGTMEYRQIEVLSEDWVLAVYDDGHIQGKSIFRYELGPDQEVRFSPVISKLPQ